LTSLASQDLFVVIEERNDCLQVENADSDWIVDSDASYHATPHMELFTSYKSGKFGVVYMGNQGTSNIVGIDDVCIEISMKV
jgi:hypothetical protein